MRDWDQAMTLFGKRQCDTHAKRGAVGFAVIYLSGVGLVNLAICEDCLKARTRKAVASKVERRYRNEPD
jgi:hypothetical protein